MELANILKACDHTLLRVDCTSDEIKAICDQGIRYQCASVCIPPCHVAGARRYAGDRLKICTVIGFPNGYATSAVKAFEAKDAIEKGADEIDMVINLSMVKDGAWHDVERDIMAVREATRGHVLKVIIECCLLTEEEKIRLCEIVSACGCDFIKTSTGFSKGGATREDVALLRMWPSRSRSRPRAASPRCRTPRTFSISGPSAWAPAASSSSPWSRRTPRAHRRRTTEREKVRS